jgi:vancomycin permeability regulator SanA
VFVHSGLPFPVTSPADALAAEMPKTAAAQSATATILFMSSQPPSGGVITASVTRYRPRAHSSTAARRQRNGSTTIASAGRARRYSRRVVTRRRVVIALSVLATCVVLLLAPLVIVHLDTMGDLSDSPAAVRRHHQVALVLGAGLTRDGQVTWFLRDRLDAAIALYRAGKVDGLLLSGDNRVRGHDEPGAMRAYARSQGVPAGAITLDDAGLDTYASCYRARHIFGVRTAEVVTQRYHLPRAVFLCRAVGISADGLGVRDWGRVPTGKMIHYQAREVLADVKAVWDADVTTPKPVLGRREHLNLQPAA